MVSWLYCFLHLNCLFMLNWIDWNRTELISPLLSCWIFFSNLEKSMYLYIFLFWFYTMDPWNSKIHYFNNSFFLVCAFTICLKVEISSSSSSSYYYYYYYFFYSFKNFSTGVWVTANLLQGPDNIFRTLWKKYFKVATRAKKFEIVST